jgi:hypothetical protein
MGTDFKKISFGKQLGFGAFQFLDHFMSRKIAFKLSRPLRTKYYDKLEVELKSTGKAKKLTIDRISGLNEEDFKNNYLLKNKPVILEGLAKDWACVKNWSLPYLKEKYGSDKIVLVNQEDVANSFEQLTLAEVIDGINEGLSRYYRFYPLIQRHPECLLDFDYKWMQNNRHQKIVFDAFQTFIGPDKSYTPLHNANAGNFFTQVVGEKKWVLYSNNYAPIFDPSPVASNYRTAPIRKNYGPFNPFEPEYEKPYHLFEYADYYRFTLKPGDVLYNPPYWWHAVKNIGNTIGFGYRWLPFWDTLKSNPLYTFLDLFAVRPPIWKTWKLSQIDPNLTHLAEVGKLKEFEKTTTLIPTD